MHYILEGPFNLVMINYINLILMQIIPKYNAPTIGTYGILHM